MKQNQNQQFDQALALFNKNDFAKALEAVSKIQNPDKSLAEKINILRAAISLKSGKTEQAITFLNEIESSINENKDQWINLKGIAFRAKGMLKEALSVLDEGHKQYPGSLDIAHNLAVTLTDLAQFDRAIEAAQAAKKINPNFPEIYRNLGRVYISRRDVESAKVVFQTLSKLDPGCEDVEVGFGAIALIENKPNEAIPYFEKAIAINPKGGPSWANLGICHKYLGNFQRAKECLAQAMINDPVQVEHRWNMALLQLTTGEMGPGWINYECRFDPARISVDRVVRPNTSLPMLTASDSMQGKTIILLQEQGFGDTFQFYRFARELKLEGAARVVAIVSPELNEVVRTIPWIDEAYHEVNGDITLADYWVFPMSLPARYGVVDDLTIPKPIPYIKVDPEVQALWAKRFEKINSKKIRVGLVWAGRESHTNDKNRSMKLSDFNGLSRFSDRIEFISMQKGRRENDEKDPNWKVTKCGEQIETFMDSAAIMANLDLLISIDSAPVHIAGAIGAPVWVLIPFIFDFRWMENREDSPWYPSLRLFRQKDISEGWGPVLKRLEVALEKFLDEKPTRWQPSPFYYEPSVKKSTTYAGIMLWLHSAFRYHMDGKVDQAQELYQLVLQYDPNNIDAARNLAVLLRANGNITEALALYQYGEAQQFRDADFYVNYANLLVQLDQLPTAIEKVDKALGINPKNLKALSLGAQCSERLGLLDQAVQIFSLMQTIEWSLESEIKLASLLLSQGKVNDALLRAEPLVKSHPKICEVQILAAQIYQTMDADEKAKQAYALAGAINENHPDLYFNRAILNAKIGKIEEAITDSRKAISILPQNPEFHFQLATFLLTAGQFKEGWKEYEWRMHPQRLALQRVIKPSFVGISMWQGESLKDRSILIVPEQGFGDQIQFVRYAKWLKELGATVLVGAQPPLLEIMKSCPWIDGVVGDGESFAADYWTFPMSLPMLANTELDGIPAPVPYLFANSKKVTQWKKWLGEKGINANKPIVGLCWQGDGKHVQDAKRSIPVELLEDLIKLPQYQFVGITRDQNAKSSYEIGNRSIPNAGPELVNFSDTAALLENIDLLITIDSAPAHLAGAMGKPCWILLDSFVDFRWMLDAKTSPWYPSILLYRKKVGGNWAAVIERLKKDLPVRLAVDKSSSN